MQYQYFPTINNSSFQDQERQQNHFNHLVLYFVFPVNRYHSHNEIVMIMHFYRSFDQLKIPVLPCNSIAAVTFFKLF